MIIKKPTIVIFTNQPDETLLSEICAGIEEEGVLYETEAQSAGSALSLAVGASDVSMLGSGVGIRGKNISLHIKGMNPTDPVFSFENATAEEARDLGANSARVILRLPFRMDVDDMKSE